MSMLFIQCFSNSRIDLQGIEEIVSFSHKFFIGNSQTLMATLRGFPYDIAKINLGINYIAFG